MAAELALLTFTDAAAFEAWLAEQPAAAPGAWLRFAKTGAGEVTLSKSDAIDSALAYGWIDGQLGRIDEAFFKTRFTPRRARSRWSKINRERAEALIAAGRMAPGGQAEVDAAKADGRWEAAYAGSAAMEAPPDLASALAAAPGAASLFARLDAANRYAVLYRVHHARGEARRAAKIAELVALLAEGRTIHPPKARRG